MLGEERRQRDTNFFRSFFRLAALPGRCIVLSSLRLWLTGLYVRISSAQGRVAACAVSVCLLGYGGMNRHLSLPKQVLALLDVLK